MASESIRNLGEFYGTSLASRVTGYGRLSDRITYTLGAPMVNIELHQNQIYENISIAIELFTKYAGYTTEYLVFDTKDKYEKGKGVRLDKLFGITPNLSGTYTSVNLKLTTSNPDSTTTNVSAGGGAESIYKWTVNDSEMDPTEFNIRFIDNQNGAQSVRKILVVTDHDSDAGTTTGNYTEYNVIFTGTADLASISLSAAGDDEETVHIMATTNPESISYATSGNSLSSIVVPADNIDDITEANAVSAVAFGAYDALLNQYRKVIDVVDFNEGSTTGVNTLFTIEQTLAQQTYFSYSMGQYGFDLVSWYTVKEWLDLREKLLTIKHSFVFDPHTQYLRMYPEPDIDNVRTYGIINAYLEPKVEDVLHEQWVLQYATALCKIALARIRGKYGGTGMFGGGQLDTSMLQEGLSEKEKLEQQLFEGPSPGFGDADPPMFFIG